MINLLKKVQTATPEAMQRSSNNQPLSTGEGQPKKLTHQEVKRLYGERMVAMRRKLLALGYNMQYDKPKTQEELRMQKWEVCKKHVDAWLLSDKSQVRLAMDDMSHDQLVKAVTQFEQVYKDYLKRI